MKTTFNRILAAKNHQKTFSKLKEMGFLHSHGEFTNGRGMHVIKLNKNVNHHFCLLEDSVFWNEEKTWNQKPIGDFEIIHEDEVEFSKHLCLVDFFHNNVTDHPFMIHSECKLVQTDKEGYKTVLLFENGLKDDLCSLLWEKESESLCDLANYDVAIKLHVKDIRVSSVFYSTMGFSPEAVEDNLDILQSIILKHIDIPGLKLILWQDGSFDSIQPGKKNKLEIDRKVTFVIMPKTVQDFNVIKSFYEERQMINEEGEIPDTMELYLKPANNIHFEVLYFIRPE